MNMGGPDSLEAVPYFMRNLFSDREIFRFPGGWLTQRLFARMITLMRTRKVRAQYAAIGGRSPLNDLTHAQAVALRDTLRQRGCHACVAVAMRYWRPFTDEALRMINREAAQSPVVALPLYPHFSKATTGSSLAELQRVMTQMNFKRQPLVIRDYHDHPRYIESLVERISEALPSLPLQTQVLFSAHGLPESFVREGDPYVSQIERTFELAREKFAGREFHLAYQSRVGPVKWVGPSVEEKLSELGARGVKALLVVPVSFVSDHIETLYEIDITYAQHARASGIEVFSRIRSLNGSPTFIAALADLVLDKAGRSS